MNPNPGAAASNPGECAIYVTTVPRRRGCSIKPHSDPRSPRIHQVQSIGLDAWITQQFNTPDTPLANIPSTPLPAVCLAAQYAHQLRRVGVVANSAHRPDQLRQRVAFALSEIFVISSDT